MRRLKIFLFCAFLVTLNAKEITCSASDNSQNESRNLEADAPERHLKDDKINKNLNVKRSVSDCDETARNCLQNFGLPKDSSENLRPGEFRRQTEDSSSRQETEYLRENLRGVYEQDNPRSSGTGNLKTRDSLNLSKNEATTRRGQVSDKVSKLEEKFSRKIKPEKRSSLAAEIKDRENFQVKNQDDDSEKKTPETRTGLGRNVNLRKSQQINYSDFDHLEDIEVTDFDSTEENSRYDESNPNSSGFLKNSPENLRHKEYGRQAEDSLYELRKENFRQNLRDIYEEDNSRSRETGNSKARNGLNLIKKEGRSENKKENTGVFENTSRGQVSDRASDLKEKIFKKIKSEKRPALEAEEIRTGLGRNINKKKNQQINYSDFDDLEDVEVSDFDSTEENSRHDGVNKKSNPNSSDFMKNFPENSRKREYERQTEDSSYKQRTENFGQNLKGVYEDDISRSRGTGNSRVRNGLNLMKKEERSENRKRNSSVFQNTSRGQVSDRAPVLEEKFSKKIKSERRPSSATEATDNFKLRNQNNSSKKETTEIRTGLGRNINMRKDQHINYSDFDDLEDIEVTDFDTTQQNFRYDEVNQKQNPDPSRMLKNSPKRQEEYRRQTEDFLLKQKTEDFERNPRKSLGKDNSRRLEENHARSRSDFNSSKRKEAKQNINRNEVERPRSFLSEGVRSDNRNKFGAAFENTRRGQEVERKIFLERADFEERSNLCGKRGMGQVDGIHCFAFDSENERDFNFDKTSQKLSGKTFTDSDNKNKIDQSSFGFLENISENLRQEEDLGQTGNSRFEQRVENLRNTQRIRKNNPRRKETDDSRTRSEKTKQEFRRFQSDSRNRNGRAFENTGQGQRPTRPTNLEKKFSGNIRVKSGRRPGLETVDSFDVRNQNQDFVSNIYVERPGNVDGDE